MISGSTIARMAREQEDLAQIVGKRPVGYTWEDVQTFPPFPFPNIGRHCPEGFERLTDDDGNWITLFCDSSGMGSPSEPALTAEQLGAELGLLVLKHGRPGPQGHRELFAAIVEVGQFQLVIGLYVWTGKGRPGPVGGCPACGSGSIFADTMSSYADPCSYCPQGDPDDCDNDCPSLAYCPDCCSVFRIDGRQLTHVQAASGYTYP